MTALWTSGEIATATGGSVSAPFEVTGVTFDSREVQAGDLFVAMPGTVHDGHRFVDGAFAAGAAGALVAHPVSGPHVQVDDTFAALQALGRASRQRSEAKVFGVTGSVGKTSTKEALFTALDRNCPGKVHRSVKSYNNHTGVPLSLARMPRDADYAVLEMGMNNRGEIAALTGQVRPHVALITAIAPAHIENLGSEEAIADAKAEIFEGLEPDGVAIIPNDTPHRDRLVKAARRRAARTSRSRCGVSFGTTPMPPGSRPSKISPLASAIASSEPRFSMCAGAIAVMSARCGRTMRVSAAISPGLFMPISSTANSASRGIRARLSGTPVWLL